MRLAPLSINNEYHDEDYFRVFGFPKMGKNVKVHRSVVFAKPGNVSIGDNVTIGPFCVFGEGKTEIRDGAVIDPFTYLAGIPDADAKSAEDRVKELEALLAERQANDAIKVKNE